jgi:hypothetical protein
MMGLQTKQYRFLPRLEFFFPEGAAIAILLSEHEESSAWCIQGVTYVSWKEDFIYSQITEHLFGINTRSF